jgi:hypothetical protein
MTCPAPESLLEWLEGHTPSVEIEVHLRRCAACAEQARRTRAILSMLKRPAAQEPSGCPDAQTLSALAGAGPGPSERAALLEHLGACTACRQDAVELTRIPQEEPGMIRLKIETNGAARTVEFGAGAFSIGRAQENALSLDDKKASRKHAQLRVDPEGATIADLDSSNGTRVNGEKITSAVRLRAGDIIEIGTSRVTVEAAPVAAAAPAPAPAPEPAPVLRRSHDLRRSAVARARQGTPAWKKAAMAAGVLVTLGVLAIVGYKVANTKTGSNTIVKRSPEAELQTPVSTRPLPANESELAAYHETSAAVAAALEAKKYGEAQKAIEALEKAFGKRVLSAELRRLRAQYDEAVRPDFENINGQLRALKEAGKAAEAEQLLAEHQPRFAGSTYGLRLKLTALGTLPPEEEKALARATPAKVDVTPKPVEEEMPADPIDPALARLITAIQSGDLGQKRIAFAEGKEGTVASADPKGVTFNVGDQKETVAWDEIPPRQVYNMMVATKLGGEDLLSAAQWCYGAELPGEGDQLLNRYWDKDQPGAPQRKAEVDELLARLRNEPKPGAGYVFHDGTFKAPDAVAKQEAKTQASVRSGLLASSLKKGETAEKLIDATAQEAWSRHNVQGLKTSSNAEFMRRVYLDLIGVIPSVEEAAAFLRNPRRDALIDKLLEHPRYGRQAADMWGRSIVNDDARQGNIGIYIKPFQVWLEAQFNKGVPMDKIAFELLTAEGEIEQNPQVLYITQNAVKQNGYLDTTADVSSHWMGIQISCAKCHDHPFAKWTQQNFYEMASFFTATRARQYRASDNDPFKFSLGEGQGMGVPLPPRLTDAGVTSVKPRFYNEKDPGEGDRPREKFARLLISPENRQFARAVVNRTWASLFGRGIVHPTNGFDDNNKASMPELLDQLAIAFIANDYDMRWLNRSICRSKVYQLSSESRKAPEARYFHASAIRPLTAVQLVDSLERMTGDEDMKSPRVRNELERLFEVNINNLAESKISIQQALTLLNSEMLHASIRTMVQRVSKEGRPLDLIYLGSLSRFPNAAEMTRAAQLTGRQEGLEDVAWALINSSEFIFNH